MWAPHPFTRPAAQHAGQPLVALPPPHTAPARRCAHRLAEDAVKAAIKDYEAKQSARRDDEPAEASA